MGIWFSRGCNHDEPIVAVEGMYTDQFVYCSKKATLIVGNVMLRHSTPEGAEVCNVEDHVGDRGVLARASNDHAIVVSHNPDNGTNRIKLPSGVKKIVPSGCKEMVGQVAGEEKRISLSMSDCEHRIERNTSDTDGFNHEADDLQ
ncbi:60S ribosomal protein L8-1-like [Vitis riparia]|uniref:60S ribosomal protein L8-1-like n=1 Tax=Vitis riparia TaxID=96939 RepID=UPI00155ACFDA|nr:60S ribosomal protein L8-1-like [Vitis riparia]